MKGQESWNKHFGEEAELWMDYFDTPEDALEWAEKFGSRSVAYWWLYHFRDFLQEGKITLDKISKWYEFLYDLGCFYKDRDYVNATDGKKFVEVFKTIDKAKSWLKYFSNIYTACRWCEFFPNPEIAKIMSEYFEGPYQAKNWIIQQLGHFLCDFLTGGPERAASLLEFLEEIRRTKDTQESEEIKLLMEILEKIKKIPSKS